MSANMYQILIDIFYQLNLW